MIITCLGIFLARIADVTFGTIRTVYTVKGKQFIASFIAFIEVLIWFIVAREALGGPLKNPIPIAISYSGGYAMGTLIGTFLSNHLIDGLVMVQAILEKNDKSLINKIREAGFGVSIIPLKGELDTIKKEMLLIETNKKKVKKLVNIIKIKYPNAFIIISETKNIQNGLVKK